MAVEARIVSVACGGSHSVAVDEHGSVYSWGKAANGAIHGMLGCIGQCSDMYNSFNIVGIHGGIESYRKARCWPWDRQSAHPCEGVCRQQVLCHQVSAGMP